MAKRVALTALLPTHAEPAPAAEPARPDNELRVLSRGAAPAAAPAGHRQAGPHRHFSELLRKEARLREDQVDALAQHARRLARAKVGTDERITDNTLIRVAVDLLLQRSDSLQGSTEGELRESVGL